MQLKTVILTITVIILVLPLCSCGFTQFEVPLVNRSSGWLFEVYGYKLTSEVNLVLDISITNEASRRSWGRCGPLGLDQFTLFIIDQEGNAIKPNSTYWLISKEFYPEESRRGKLEYGMDIIPTSVDLVLAIDYWGTPKDPIYLLGWILPRT